MIIVVGYLANTDIPTLCFQVKPSQKSPQELLVKTVY